MGCCGRSVYYLAVMGKSSRTAAIEGSSPASVLMHRARSEDHNLAIINHFNVSPMLSIAYNP